jgi:3-oxoacid CoA-transferase subunit A
LETPQLNKIVPNFDEAVSDIPDGAMLMIDGFAGPGGTAQNLIRALRDHGARDLTIISNTAGLASVMGFGTLPGDRPIDIGILVDNEQVNKVIASFPVSPSPSRPTSFERAYLEGKVELEVVPQGTLAERIRAGGAGIPAFYTPTGVGTQIAEGKEIREFDGREYAMERSLNADFALLRANVADTLGNTTYRGTSQNFNGVMATAAKVTIIEVDEIVEPGGLDSAVIHTPALYVNRMVKIS